MLNNESLKALNVANTNFVEKVDNSGDYSVMIEENNDYFRIIFFEENKIGNRKSMRGVGDEQFIYLINKKNATIESVEKKLSR